MHLVQCGAHHWEFNENWKIHLILAATSTYIGVTLHWTLTIGRIVQFRAHEKCTSEIHNKRQQIPHLRSITDAATVVVVAVCSHFHRIAQSLRLCKTMASSVNVCQTSIEFADNVECRWQWRQRQLLYRYHPNNMRIPHTIPLHSSRINFNLVARVWSATSTIHTMKSKALHRNVMKRTTHSTCHLVQPSWWLRSEKLYSQFALSCSDSEMPSTWCLRRGIAASTCDSESRCK